MSVIVAPSTACRNCGATLGGRFCASCGQDDRPLDPSLRELVAELAREITNLDGRVPRTVRRLFLSPGFLTREYVEGRRAAWVAPIRLYLVFSVCYFAVTAFTGVSPLDVDLQITGSSDADRQQAVQRLGFPTGTDLQRAVNQAIATWIPRAMFVLVPAFAWLVSLARRRAGRKYPHHLIFSLHLFAAFFGAQTVAVAAGSLTPGVTADAVFGLGALLYAVAYMTIALRTVYGGTLARALFHTVLVLVGYWLATMVVVAAIVAPAVFWK